MRTSGIALGRTFTMRETLRREGLEGLRVPPGLRGLALEQVEQAIFTGKARLEGNVLVPDMGGGSRQYWQETLAWATAAGTAVANTTTETIVFPDVTIPGNYMQDGRAIRIKASGAHSTLGSGTVTLIFAFRWGGVSGTVIAETGTITQVVSLTSAQWVIDIEIQTRSNGSTGTLIGGGTAHVFSGTAPTIGSATGSPAEAPFGAAGQTVPAAVTLDLTADTALSFTVKMGAASASNTVVGHQYTIASLN